ncbi:MAG: hypothetical protein HUU34_02325 [Saprospiraceae bacterium]|nr:hypothetical protein [Saprospiraceae bacterium]
MKKTLVFCLFSFFSTPLLFSQGYLGDDLAFFQKKASLYQEWLESKGMGKSLKMDKVELKKNGNELELFLSVRTHDPDSAAAIWTALVADFKKQNPDEELVSALFHTFVRLMEIPPVQGNVQVYFPNKNSAGYNPCFYVWIWEVDNKVKEESRVNNCKAQGLSITVEKPVVKAVSTKTATSISNKEQARVVFDKVLKYARQRYEVKKCEERNPRVEEDETTDYTLTFVVTDLCKEVLKEEEKSLWCDFVSRWWGPCNDMRRERLEFTFNYIATDTGYTLTGSLTGKFGSGVYVPRKSGYMDMEPDFEEDFLKPYVKQFQKDLKKYLEK